MRSPSGASAEILRRARQGSISALASVSLAIEYQDVCSRTEHLIAAGFTMRETRLFLDAVLALVEPVNIWFLWRPQLRDAGDEMVLEAAVNGRADAIVTFNIRDFEAAPRLFGIELWSPKQTLMRIAS